MTLPRPIKHLRCNIVVCGCVLVEARAIPVLFPRVLPGAFFIFSHPPSVVVKVGCRRAVGGQTSQQMLIC